MIILYYYLYSLKGKRAYGAKKGVLREKIISPSIFEARCSGLEQTVVAVESYNIAMIMMIALYPTLNVAIHTDC